MTPEDPSLFQICPSCWSLGDPGLDQCPRCRIDIGWVRRFQRARDALTLDLRTCDHDGARIVLCAEVRWAAGESHFHGPANGPLALPIPGCREAQMTWPAASAELNLSLDGKSVPIPMHRPWRGPDVELVAWLKAIPRAELVPQSERRAGEGALGLNRPDEATIGRDAEENQLYVGDAEELHCVCTGVDPQGAGAPSNPETHGSARSWHYWVVDNQSQTGTFVNRRPIIAARLLGGDVVQVGPSQWIFNETDGFLLPLGCDSGAALLVGGLEIPGRLSVPSLHVKAGEFVSVVGESGSGKSTLLKVLAGEVSPGKNCIYVNDGNGEYDTEIDRDRYRSILGYLSQEAIVHKELTPLEILRFSAQLRKGKHDRGKSRETLRRLRVRESRWEFPLHELSGGEQQRVRIASELVAEPLILLFDEPASGLDREHEKQLARSLQRLSWTGCTVIMVTHGDEIDLCDRVLHFKKRTTGHDIGEIDFDGTPPDYRRWNGQPRFPAVATTPKKEEPQGRKRDSKIRRRIRSRPGALSQFSRLAQREWRLLRSESWKRLVLPLVVVPAFFALAFSLAFTEAGKNDLLGFFCVLGVIWMGASQSLTAIAGEREVFDHEQLLFLRTQSYVFAKMVVGGLLSSVQTFVFVGLLYAFQRFLGSEAILFGPGWVLACLALINLTAVGLGLMISAISGRSRHAGNLLLPLMMIIQIVFSVYVCGQAEGKNLYEAYKGFCFRSRFPAANAADQDANDRMPGWPSSAISYLTLSRHGDIWLRSFATDNRAFAAFTNPQGVPKWNVTVAYDYPRWRRRAAVWLAAYSIVFPIATWCILRFQSRRHWGGSVS